MKNLIIFIVVVGCIALIYFGIMKENNKTKIDLDKMEDNETLIIDNKSSSSSPSGAPAVSPVTNQPLIQQTMIKYYPDNETAADGSGSNGSTASADRNFQITSRLMAQMYLVDKYKPGICIGTPIAPPQVAVNGMISSDPQLAKFIKQQYHLSSDLDVYNKIKQLQGVFLTETQSGKFDFEFTDGQCATVVKYYGTVEVIGNQVTNTLTSQTSHTFQ